MSIDIERTKPRTADYGRYLSRQLRNAQGRIKAVDLVTGAVIVVVGVIAYTLSVIMLDQIFTLSMGMRIGLLAFFGIMTVGYVAYAVVLPAARRINPLYAARRVESVAPETKNSIVNWLLLHENGAEIPEPIMRVIEARAASDLSKIDLGEAIDTKHILRASYGLAVVVVSFCVFLFFTTKELTPSLKRVLFPLAEIAPPTETKLTRIEPGTTDIAAGDKVTISAYASGKEPETITVYVSSDDGEYWEPIRLDSPVERYGRWQVTLNDRQKSFDYYLVANDFKSEKYRVRVSAAPLVLEWKVEYLPPAYTGEPRRTEQGGDIDALEGTLVELEVTTNVPVRAGSGKIDFHLGVNRPTQSLDPVAGSENRLVAKFALGEEGTYQVSFEDLLGRKPQFRPVKTIRVRRDAAPVLAFVEPTETSVEKPVGSRFPLRLSASDDYGLAKVRFHLEREQDGKVLMEEELRAGDEPLGRSRLFVIPIDLARLGVKAGETLNYWADAEDNKLPVSNLVSTQDDGRTIKVIEPPKPEPGQKQTNDPKQEQARDQKSEPDSRDAQRSDQGEQPKESQPTPSEEGNQQQGEQSEKSSPDPSSGENQPGTPSDSRNAESSQTESGASGEHGESSREGASPRDGEDGEGSQEDRKDSRESADPAERLDKEDRQSLDKLKEYFDRKGDSKRSDSKDQNADRSKEEKEGPRSADRSKTDRNETKGNQQDSRKPSSPGPSDETKDTQPEDAPTKEPSSDKRDPASEDPSTDPSTDPKAEKARKEKDERAGDEKEAGEKGDQAEQERTPGADQGDQGSEKASKEDRSRSEERSRPDAKSKESGTREKSKTGTEGEQEESSRRAREKSESKENQGAGKEGDRTTKEPKETQAPEPGDAAQKDKGKESSRGDQKQPKPKSDEPSNDKQPPKGSKKEGEQDSASNEKGNTEGDSGQGESAKSGESSTGSPSEEQGDNENSGGEQKGKGQSEKPGEGKSGDPSSNGKEGAESREKNAGSESKGQDPKEGKSASREPSSEESKPGEGAGSKDGAEAQEDAEPSGTDSKSDSKSKQDSGESAKGSEKVGKQQGSSEPGAKESTTSERQEDQGLESGQGDIVDNTGEAADPSDKKKGSELVLKKLQEELKKKKIDPDLLKELGWTEQEARDFAKRLEKTGTPKEAPADPLTGKAREGFGSGTQLRKSASRAAGALPRDDQQDLFQGSRTAPPPEYRELFEAYTRSLSKTGKAAPEKKETPPATGTP